MKNITNNIKIKITIVKKKYIKIKIIKIIRRSININLNIKKFKMKKT